MSQDKEESTASTVPPDSLVNQEDGRKYWQGIDASVCGMMGGYPQISNIDLKGSRALLSRFGFGANKKGLVKAKRVLEGGAGIGRITRGLLADVAETVDVIEPIQKFTDKLKDVSAVGRVFNCGLEEWSPQLDDRYDVVWNQWCVGHLNDAQLVDYLRKCGTTLTPDTGIIVVKENLCRGEDVLDTEDSCVTRSNEKFKAIFDKAELRLVYQHLQKGFPQHLGLYPVIMYALKPSSSSSTTYTA